MGAVKYAIKIGIYRFTPFFRLAVSKKCVITQSSIVKKEVQSAKMRSDLFKEICYVTLFTDVGRNNEGRFSNLVCERFESILAARRQNHLHALGGKQARTSCSNTT